MVDKRYSVIKEIKEYNGLVREEQLAIVDSETMAIRLVDELRELSQTQMYYYKEYTFII